MKIGSFEFKRIKPVADAPKPPTSAGQPSALSYGGVLAPFTEDNSRLIMENMPIDSVAKGRLTDFDITKAKGDSGVTIPGLGMVRDSRVLNACRMTEADAAVAQTTLVLGQYAPQFGWPDDWALYWEYLDARMLVPEVAWATKLKNRMIWKNGFEIATKDEHAKDEFKAAWRKLNLEPAFKALAEWAMIEGNGYAEIVDDSEAFYSPQPNAGAIGADIGVYRSDLLSWQPATRFFGLKILDPRTMRVYIRPDMWDLNRAEPLVDRYIQRKWTGPLGPNTYTWAQSEIPLYPAQVVHLRFNRVVGGIYGYSMIRESFFTLKAYLLMMQYLPAIVQKRADVKLHVKYGGDMKNGDNVQTFLAPAEGMDAWIARTSNIAPSEDLYTDIFTTIEQIYKNEGTVRGINELIQIWKERILIGLNTPSSLLDPQGAAVGEIKWGGLKFEMLENEILEYQQEIARVINEKIVPRVCTGDAEFHFNPITPEDWRANVAPLLDLYQAGAISQEYMLSRLNMPQNAGKGTMYSGSSGGKAPGASLTPAGVQNPETWKVSKTEEGSIRVERE